jgi:hypothetical protein
LINFNRLQRWLSTASDSILENHAHSLRAAGRLQA